MNSQDLSDNFVEIPFTTENLDRFVVRTSILKALKHSLAKFTGRLLDVGCGKMPYKQFIFENTSITEYIGLDIQSALEYDEKIKPDFFWNGLIMPFPDESFETLMATEVLEHCPEPDIILKESFRVLKPGGIYFFTTPFLWSLHEVPHDEYRYTPFSLRRHLAKAGFREIEIYASGGWHASLAQLLGLWVRRSPMKPRRRKYISMIVKPVVKRLLRWDANSKIEFKEGAMINTIYGIARR